MVMVKSDGFFIPAPLFMTLVITFRNVNEPGKGGHLPFTGFEPSGQGGSIIGILLPLLSLPDLSPLPDPVDVCELFFLA